MNSTGSRLEHTGFQYFFALKGKLQVTERQLYQAQVRTSVELAEAHPKALFSFKSRYFWIADSMGSVDRRQHITIVDCIYHP